MAEHKLPRAATALIGRDEELAEIMGLLSTLHCRLLTLLGPGGIGKTRLAVEVASRMTFHFADGVYFVPLQALLAVEDIVPAVIDALPLQLTDNTDPELLLLKYLNDRHLLLVLDNFEHLLDGVELISRILNGTDQVQLLITSRERLNLQTEQTWPLRGLDVPEEIPDPAVLSSAVRLFDERARRVQPDFLLEAHWAAVASICQLVDGIPLALELAASWVRALPCETIASEIKRSVDILTSSQRDLPERHQSMRAVFDHSWKLLSEDEHAVFCKLTVFHGGFTVEAAQEVAGASLRTLASLIDKSLLQLDDSGRYAMHELLRQYGDEQLEAAGAGQSTRDAHRRYYAEFVCQRVDDLKGRRQIEAIAEINADFENVRAAWRWAADRQSAEMIEQMIEGLWVYCDIRHREQDRLALFRYAERTFAAGQGEGSQRLWGRLLARAAGEVSQTQIEIALEIARQFNDPAEIAFCLAQSGFIAYRSREYDKAIPLLEQSESLYRQLDDHYNTALVLFHRVSSDPSIGLGLSKTQWRRGAAFATRDR